MCSMGLGSSRAVVRSDGHRLWLLLADSGALLSIRSAVPGTGVGKGGDGGEKGPTLKV